MPVDLQNCAEPGICIVHADAAIVVLHKPSGLLSVPGRGADKQDCLSARVQAEFADALTHHGTGIGDLDDQHGPWAAGVTLSAPTVSA